MAREPQASYCIKVDYEKGSKDPARVFRTASELISSFCDFDKILAKSVHSRIDPILLLEDVETGSIKIWLRNFIEDIDDEGIKNLDVKLIVGGYLVKAKYLAIDFLGGRTTITDRKELEVLQKNILDAAKETDVIHIPSYTPIALPDLADGLGSISSALTHLSGGDKASIVTPYGEVGFNLEFRYAPKRIDELLTEDIMTSTSELIVKVKKPDYLGDSMWDLRHGHNTFPAKIQDFEWIGRFQGRELDIRPGDALRVLMEVTARYDKNGELIAQSYVVVKVYEIIPGNNQEQHELLKG